ncbi:MAG TPA: hypothetical protein VLM05_07195 [Mycobacteriales bacterium]|nr:hypothetical protein [Mycobacteriales bacterium]
MRLTEARAVLRRSWYVVLAGVLCTLAASALVHRAPGIYHQQVDVVFAWPQPPDNGENTLQYGTGTLINTAGVVATIVAGSTEGGQVVADTATAVGEGIRHGYTIRLPNAGGQWAYNFEDPVLRIESVGSSPQEVVATTARAVAKVRAALLTLQRDEHVRPAMMVQTRLNPGIPIVQYSTGSRMRALLVTWILGAGLTVAALHAAGRLHRRRPRPAAPAAPARELTPA